MQPSTASAPPWCLASVLGVTHVSGLNCYRCPRTVPSAGLTFDWSGPASPAAQPSVRPTDDMYPVDERDTVVGLDDCPRPDIEGPLPLVLSDDYNLVLAYLVSEPDPNWDGSYATVVSSQSEELLVAVGRFRRPYAHMFGPPNDEAFRSHPLADRGLEAYSVSEVHDSSWLRQLERMNSVHHNHDRAVHGVEASFRLGIS